MIKTKDCKILTILFMLELPAFAQQPDSVSARAQVLSQKLPTATSDSLAPQAIILPQAAKDTTSLSFKATDIRDIFRALAYQHGVNIFVDNAVNKRTTGIIEASLEDWK